MGKTKLKDVLTAEVARIDKAQIAKRHERVIEGFTDEPCPRAVIGGKKYHLFNSNDYLGLRFHEKLREAEEEASRKYGAGPGAVRFISGSMFIHQELEKEIASFHGREDAMVFSSAFAVNMAVIHCMIKGQSKDSLVENSTLVISDQLNHRSIIDGIRVAGLPRENKAIFKHMDLDDLRRVLEENAGKFKRALVISDGIFSMLGEAQDIKKLQEVIDAFDDKYEQGVLSIIDDAHGVGCYGAGGKGCEEMFSGKCDLLIGTMGKAFGADGGYVTGDKEYIEYLRESAATYIYSNPISPGTAGAALAALRVIQSAEGKKLLETLAENVAYFKDEIKKAGFTLAVESDHGIQPILIGDAEKTKALTNALFDASFIVTNINYPVVPKGADEIRVQLSSLHQKEDIDAFIAACKEAWKLIL
ncbi:MAG: aminotransferase class I/II-fold pyridoxal phosphate-dependent enzyme [Candidatus Woesearchaeota archaeon]|nr:aminotransferase class I/II-fold pyridoxal phosphate-dependent enzyme [Candidatus Woesearchaeota archaeon]